MTESSKDRVKADPKSANVVNDAEFQIALRKVANNKAGQVVLRGIMNRCGFKQSVLAMREGVVQPDAMLFNEGRRSIWLNLRDDLKKAPDLLNLIEMEKVPDEDPEVAE